MPSPHIDYPWVVQDGPLIVSAPMMKISLSRYALATSAAGGLGFIGAGFDLTPLAKDLAESARLIRDGHYPNLALQDGILPIGVGVQNWGSDVNQLFEVLKSHPVAAVWFFGPKKIEDLEGWATRLRELDPIPKLWVQIGSVAEALTTAKLVKPDVIVAQGSDAGGHGLAERAGIVTLLPEMSDALAENAFNIPLIAAGGIMDGRGTAAAVCLGAAGVCMGTRLLASEEAVIAKGYQNEVLRARDGGVSTTHTIVYDYVRGIHGWPSEYDGRGIINQSYLDAQNGMSREENERLYKEEMKKGDSGWGQKGRMTTYAGTGVGLVTSVKSIKSIVEEVRTDVQEILSKQSGRWSAGGSKRLNGTTSLVATN